jgi:hypothetical protein
MLVIGTTRDPATPYTWAVRPARQLPGALLTCDGDGHTAHQRSGCIDKAVDAHLVDLRLPPGTRCS